MKRAFTLIELLIVVAIIAILAAIAVPNFLEAQTRSKVSRAKADQRTLATAIESYTVDWNRCPQGIGELKKAGCVGYVDLNATNWTSLGKLTTPVAYITSVPKDPFQVGGSVKGSTGNPNYDVATFSYQTFQCDSLGAIQLKCRAQGYLWCLISPGPSRNIDGAPAYLLLGTGTGANATFAYDPTNGTMSWGWVVRTNKGIFTVPGS